MPLSSLTVGITVTYIQSNGDRVLATVISCLTCGQQGDIEYDAEVSVSGPRTRSVYTALCNHVTPPHFLKWQKLMWHLESEAGLVLSHMPSATKAVVRWGRDGHSLWQWVHQGLGTPALGRNLVGSSHGRSKKTPTKES